MLKVMRNKEIKQILSQIEEQFGCLLKEDYVFLEGPEERIYITTKQFLNIDLTKLRVNNIGLYFGTKEKQGFRLSIEGTELLNSPKKNVIELNDEDFKAYMAGENLRLENSDGYKILKYKNHFVGCGKLSKNTLYNYLPKQRRAKEKL
ncbi:hypothetical protein J4438_02970 [Candidatus Woesearchaeota archaeon]|nr:hypothetical protein [Candidatus Woesearchaeota archaeon]